MIASSKVIPQWFSAAELAKLGSDLVAGLPTTAPGCKGRAESEGWEQRTVKGKGGKGGMRTEYMPTGKVKDAIEDYFNAGKSRHAEQEVVPWDSESNHNNKKDRDIVYVKRYVDVHGSAGPGFDNGHDDGLVQLVEFNATALHQFVRVPAQYLVIASVDGYSMEPHLFHGDQVFIDTRHQALQNDGVYAILQEGHLRFKRIRVNYADKTILIKSDNDGGLGPEILSSKQAETLKIIGKVIPFKFGHFKL